jgi:hypothetical protein
VVSPAAVRQPHRDVTLVLVDAAGRRLGALPPVPVPTPWWQETADVVAAVRDRYGLDVTVLRLLAADRPAPPGGAVTYLAQVDGARPDGALTWPGRLEGARPDGALTWPGPPDGGVPAGPAPLDVDLAGHPLRAPYAEPGGPAASLAWARAELARLGLGVPAVIEQRRTWNLSAIWRLDLAPGPSRPGGRGERGGPVWLKQVPEFFAHEAEVLRWLDGAVPGVGPRLLAAAEPGRMLLAHVPGEDRYGAPAAERVAMAAALHRVQRRAAGSVDDLIGLGVPDRRVGVLRERLVAVGRRHGYGIDGLPELLAGLPAVLAAVTACGLPDTLVHGDFHPGNVRAAGEGPITVIDWGDAFLGNPAFDVLRLVGDLPGDAAAPLLSAWSAWWRGAVPGSRPLDAVELLRPVAELLAAAAYAGFLDRIEPTEHPYHAGDVPDRLRRAVAEARRHR